MPTFLFDRIVFGPVYSRRLGISLGINLLPDNCKVCNFNCIYCECGLTFSQTAAKGSFPKKCDVYRCLEKELAFLKSNGEPIDAITFAGNGEPTLHPDFPQIIDDTIELRDNYFPNTCIAVLSNATTLNNSNVFQALGRVDKNILKLDSVYESTIKKINQPGKAFNLQQTIENLKAFDGNVIIQTLFLEGSHNGKDIGNTSDKEVEAWLQTIAEIKPKEVMVYTISRDTPLLGLQKAKPEKLGEIAAKVENLGFKVQISI